MTDEVTIRFVADAMLGRLAKWLRLLGYDTLYDPACDDAQLVRMARAEDRVLLTRDLGLARRRGAHVVLVRDESLPEQLWQLQQQLQLHNAEPWTRCPVCNELLEAVTKDRAWGQVPTYVFLQHSTFRVCPRCSRFYWRGTHWDRMDRLIRQVQDAHDG